MPLRCHRDHHRTPRRRLRVPRCARHLAGTRRGPGRLRGRDLLGDQPPGPAGRGPLGPRPAPCRPARRARAAAGTARRRRRLAAPVLGDRRIQAAHRPGRGPLDERRRAALRHPGARGRQQRPLRPGRRRRRAVRAGEERQLRRRAGLRGPGRRRRSRPQAARGHLRRKRRALPRATGPRATSSSPARPNSSRASAGTSSSWPRPRPAPTSPASRPRASAARATTGTTSGTRRCT